MALFLIGVTLATCALAAADSAGGALATGEALAKAAAPSGARVVELALDSLVATSTPWPFNSDVGPGCFSVRNGGFVWATWAGLVPRADVAPTGPTNVRAATEVSVAVWLTLEKTTPAPTVAPTTVATRTTRALWTKLGAGAR
jgi:hypothetical protein